MSTNDKLRLIRDKEDNERIRIMIIGLGSVGNYLLNYLISTCDPGIEIIVVGRDSTKLNTDVNISTVAGLIRGEYRTKVTVVPNVNLEDVNSIAECLRTHRPDIIVNSSRAYPGLKYGSISWSNIRAYGIWAPLSIKFVKNIMRAYSKSNCNAIVINTSYPDATNAWIRSADVHFPDFGSGNINHLIPRIKLSVASMIGIDDPWNIDITYATSHFHDVVISKEGQTEGVDQLIHIEYKGKVLNLNHEEMFKRCSIPMPTDSKRNMMNASSNFEIIEAILSAVREKKNVKIHCPGPFGEIGGYPVLIDGSTDKVSARIFTEKFDIESMRGANRKSIYLDGIEQLNSGTLSYTDELCEKVHARFGVLLPKNVHFSEIDETAEIIIKNIIEKTVR